MQSNISQQLQSSSSSTSKGVYPNTADAYELIEEIGIGTHTSVWRALCKPLNTYVAIKKFDLEKYPNVLEDLRVRESIIIYSFSLTQCV
jgi:serine/threonine protein kinase